MTNSTTHLNIADDLHKGSFWLAIANAIFIVLNQGFGWHVGAQALESISGTVIAVLVSSHVLASAHVKAAATVDAATGPKPVVVHEPAAAATPTATPPSSHA